MKLSDLVTVSHAVAATRSRLEKARHLADLLGRAQGSEVPLVVSYLSSGIRQGRIGIGYATLATLSRVEPADTPALELLQLDRIFDDLEAVSGAGSSQRRADLLSDLFEKGTADEQNFIRRLLGGELRHGSLEGIMIEGVAKASGLPAAAVRRALMVSGDLGEVALAALSDGETGLERFQIELLRPVQPMLAQTADDVEDALATLGRAAFEVKLDGARIQVHRSGDDVRVFTRRLNDVSHACPEVVASIRALPTDKLILDGEVIALQERRPALSFSSNDATFRAPPPSEGEKQLRLL